MYLTQHDDPSHIKANVHMDMVGGGPVTKAVFGRALQRAVFYQ